MLNKLDLIDKRILKALQHNGRLQNIELAEQVGLSPSPCLRRVKLLEERGVIQRYVALIDPEKVGKSLGLKKKYCAKCDVSFSQNYTLKRHMKRKHGVGEWTQDFGDCFCQECDIVFSSKYSFQRHNRRNHKTKISEKSDECSLNLSG